MVITDIHDHLLYVHFNSKLSAIGLGSGSWIAYYD